MLPGAPDTTDCTLHVLHRIFQNSRPCPVRVLDIGTHVPDLLQKPQDKVRVLLLLQPIPGAAGLPGVPEGAWPI